jgi:hypothetical protein
MFILNANQSSMKMQSTTTTTARTANKTTTTTANKTKVINKNVNCLRIKWTYNRNSNMTKHVNKNYYNPIVYCRADTDRTSLDRLEIKIITAIQNTQQQQQPLVNNIPRSCEVGQSFVSL